MLGFVDPEILNVFLDRQLINGLTCKTMRKVPVILSLLDKNLQNAKVVEGFRGKSLRTTVIGITLMQTKLIVRAQTAIFGLNLAFWGGNYFFTFFDSPWPIL